MGKVVKGWKKWGKVGIVGKSGKKVAKSVESWKKLGNVGKSGEKWLYPFQSQTVLACQPHSVLNASDFVESETRNAFYLRSPEDLFTDAPNDLL